MLKFYFFSYKEINSRSDDSSEESYGADEYDESAHEDWRPSKSDLLDEELKEEIKKNLPKDTKSIFISSVSQEGLIELKDMIWKKLNNGVD